MNCQRTCGKKVELVKNNKKNNNKKKEKTKNITVTRNYHPTDPSEEPKERKNVLIFNKKKQKK
jgi:hypothetical protein